MDGNEAQPPVAAVAETRSLAHLSDELILWILALTDVPDILAFSRTCHRFRTLSLDPLLHIQRLHEASARVSSSLASRPSISSLLPPHSTIYLSTTHVLARKLSRQLVAIRLNRNLSRRPSATSLVKSNIVPQECCRCDHETGEVVWGGRMSPSILEVKRRVERERVKDGLRAWLERKAETINRQVACEEDRPGGVRNLVKRFTSKKSGTEGADGRWGAASRRRGKAAVAATAREAPPRAHVYGLRRFWEGMAKGQSPDVRTAAH